jgi:hypothetical protein
MLGTEFRVKVDAGTTIEDIIMHDNENSTYGKLKKVPYLMFLAEI